MAQRTIMRLYDGYDAVVQIVHRLELAGVPDGDISVVTSNNDGRYRVLTEAAQRGAATLRAGAAIGGTLGFCCGILLEIGALGFPPLGMFPLGPMARAGWVAALLSEAAGAAAAGAAAGLVIGGVARLVVRRDPTLVYAQGISRGDTLLAVRVPDAIAPRVERLMGIADEAAPVPAARRRIEAAKACIQHE